MKTSQKKNTKSYTKFFPKTWAFNLALVEKRNEKALSYYLWSLDREKEAFRRAGNHKEFQELSLKMRALRPYALGVGNAEENY